MGKSKSNEQLILPNLQSYTPTHHPYWQSSLFNEVYLRQDLTRQSFWNDDSVGPGSFSDFVNDFRNICTALKKENFDDWNEADTIRNWIMPIMEMLGWHDKCSTHTNPILDNLALSESDGQKTKSYRPDLIYVDDPDEKKLVTVRDSEQKKIAARTYTKIVVEAKAWRVLEASSRKEQLELHKKRKTESANDDTAGLSFQDQCLKYMDLLNLDFGVLTDGHTWQLLNKSLSSEGSARRSFQFSLGHAFRTGVRLLDDRDGQAWREFTENLKYFFYLFRKEAYWPADNSYPLTKGLLDYSKKYVDSIEEDLKESFVTAMTIICNGYKNALKKELTESELSLIRKTKLTLLS